MDRSCNVALVEGMHVNWTFHRQASAAEPSKASKASKVSKGALKGSKVSSSDFLHCWVRPEKYLLRLQTGVTGEAFASQPPQGTWEDRCIGWNVIQLLTLIEIYEA